jgi:hypothetical protein
VSSAGIDLGHATTGDHVANVEWLVTAPAVTTAQLPDSKVFIYTLEGDDNSSFSSATTLVTLGTQTGAGGAGSAAASYRYRLPTNAERYLRLKITPSGSGTGDASGVSATLEGVF